MSDSVSRAKNTRLEERGLGLDCGAYSLLYMYMSYGKLYQEEYRY